MPSTKHFLRDQFRKLSALGNAPTDEMAIKGIVEQWERLLGLVGEERFAAAVSRCIRDLTFFPTVQEVEDRIPRLAAQRCEACQKTNGFIYADVTSGSGKVTAGVKRCRHGE